MGGGGWTPLAETMEDVWDYFSGQDSPIQDWCQNNFVILVTDGLPTKDSDDLSSGMKRNWDLDGGGTLDDSEENVYPSEGSDYMDDIAFYMYEHDARPDLQHGEEKRNIITYTIGFSTANRLLVDTAFNGNGFHGHEAEEWLDPESPLYRKYFYIAGDQKELREAISAAMREISLVASSGTGATLVSTGMSTDDLVFRASFHPVGWRGFLEAFEIKEDQGFELGEVKWEAGEFLRGMDLEDRRVWTALKSLTGADTKIRFIADNVTTKDVDNEQLFKLLDATNARDGEDIINFIRGADVPGYRERDGYRLGDIIHSTPVVVGPPNGYYHDPSYLEFRREHRSRERILYVGANDGMLHAFYVDGPDGGKEAWGFIPNNLLGRLKHLMDRDYESCHEYFVDLTPTVVDVFVDPDGLGPETQQWRTLLIGGEREGGEAYFALDVTEPDSDQFRPLWEFSDSRLGGSWSMPAVEKIDFGERGKWLAFVGNGFNNETGEGYLFAIDLETGENFRDPIPLESESPNVLANPRAVDIDGDDYVDSLFAGDLSGSVWRFDISDQTGSPKTYEPLDPAEWEAQEIFRALPGQAITQQVGLSFSCSGPTDQTCHNLVIYFGTGKFLTIEDKTDTSLQSFYAIKDQFSDDIITRDQMRSRTTSADCEQVPDPHQIKGWYVDLDAPGERLSSPPLVVGGLVFFLTFVPDEDACSAGGTTWLYYREFDTGCVPKETVSGEDPAPEGEEEERPVGKILVGPGYASPIVYYAKTQDMMIQTSDRTIHRRRVILPQKGIENYAWREVFY